MEKARYVRIYIICQSMFHQFSGDSSLSGSLFLPDLDDSDIIPIFKSGLSTEPITHSKSEAVVGISNTPAVTAKVVDGKDPNCGFSSSHHTQIQKLHGKNEPTSSTFPSCTFNDQRFSPYSHHS
jgi:hypothetical protein